MQPLKNWMQDCMLMRFAKCIQIILVGDENYVNISHADGAGTKKYFSLFILERKQVM
jgi:hypothetical protein